MEDLKKIIAERDINIVHFHAPILAAYVMPYLRAWKPELRFVVMTHGWPERRAQQFGVSYVLGKFLIGISRPDHFVILDDGSQVAELQEVMKRHSVPCTTVFHAIDTAMYRPSDHGSMEPTAFTILFPHRPIPIKRPDIALKIFERFLSEVNDPTISMVFLAVKSSHRSTVFTNAEGPSCQIVLMGGLDQDAMVDRINMSSVVIGTSLNSNKGLATQESMACEKPVIVFDTGRMSELITNMDNGILVESGNIDKFIEALRLLYQNPDLRRSIGINARKTILEYRSWEKRIESELSVYRNVLR